MKHHVVDQNSPEWDALRVGLPSASGASRLIKSKGERSDSLPKYAKELALSKFAGYNVSLFGGNEATERGHEIEPLAGIWYSMVKRVEIQECGFFTDDLIRYGASPDRLVGDDGLVEIKCHLESAFLDLILAYDETRKVPAKHYAQIQMQLLTTERQWCDLVIYHPQFEMLSTIIRVEADHLYQEKLKTYITACITKRDEIIKKLEKIAA